MLYVLVKTVIQRIGKDDIGAYGAALAYNFLFALVPFALLLTALLGFLHLPENPRLWLAGPLQTLLPSTMTNLIIQYGQDVVRERHPALISIGALGFIWGMSGAFRQLIDAFNHAYEFPLPRRRPIWRMYLLSLGAGAGIGILIVTAVAMVLFGTELFQSVIWLIWRFHLSVTFGILLRWVTLLTCLWLALALSYTFLPDRRQPFEWRAPGTIMALLLWLLFSWGFTIYARDFAHYNRIYGSLGQIILLLLYLYLTGFVILIGAEINAVWHRLKSRQ